MTKPTEQAFKKLPIFYVGDNFKEWFYPLAFNSKAKVKKLESQKLPRDMNDGEIIGELNPGEVSIEEIVATLETLDHSAWALFYCKDINGALRAVSVSWRGDGWYVYAYVASLSDLWGDGSHVFSRNLVNAKKLGTSDPLTLEPLVARIEKLEKTIEKIKQALQ